MKIPTWAQIDVSGALVWSLIALTVVLSITVWWISPTFHTAGYPMDEGTLLAYPERVLAGAIPGKDFEHFYGPGNLWTLAGAFYVFGASIEVERAVGVLYRLVLVAAVFGVCRRHGLLPAIGGGLVSASCVAALGSSALAWFGGLCLAVAALFCLSQWASSGAASRRWLFAAGTAMGGTLLFRLDLGLAIGGMSLALVATAGWAERRPFLAGLTLSLTPYILVVILTGFERTFRGLVWEPLEVQRTGRRLPLPPANDETNILFWLVLAVSIGFAAFVIAGRRRNGTRSMAVDLATAALGLALLPQMLQRADVVHVLYVLAVVGALLPSVTARLLQNAPTTLRLVATIAATVLVVILVQRAVDTNVGVGSVPSYWVEHGDRRFPLPSPVQAAELSALLDEAEHAAEPGSRLFVGPADLRRTNYNDTYIYFMLPEFEPATYFLEMNPGALTRRGGRLVTDLTTADIVILTDAYDGWSEDNGSSKYGSEEANDVIEADFCPVSRRLSWTLLVRCGER